MTTPTLSFGVRTLGRHYPYEPVDPSGWPRNRWGSVDPDNIPDHVDALPSVTNILSVCDKPALKGWAAERALIELYGSESIPTSLETAVERHKFAFTRYAKQRADAGTRAHTLAERLTADLPLPSSMSDEDAAYADAFMAWWSDHDPSPLNVEATVMDARYGYAGTADLIAEIDGVPYVVDYKTRAERDDKKLKRYGALYDETKMQLAALSQAEEVAEPVGDGWKLAPNTAAMPAMGVVLFPDGTYVTEVVELSDIEDRWLPAFLGARQLWAGLKGATA